MADGARGRLNDGGEDEEGRHSRPRGGEGRLDDIKQGVESQTYLEVVSPMLPAECSLHGGLGETFPPNLVLLLLLVSIPHLQK